MRKTCRVCGKRKNKKSFSKHIHHKDNLDSRCKHCVKKQSRVRNKLYKKAPNKPMSCQCCGKIVDLVLDHDHTTNKFRGWICDSCNIAIGKLGDNLEGITKAFNYLYRYSIEQLS